VLAAILVGVVLALWASYGWYSRRRLTPREPAPGTCVACGTPVDANASSCAGCGWSGADPKRVIPLGDQILHASEPLPEDEVVGLYGVLRPVNDDED